MTCICSYRTHTQLLVVADRRIVAEDELISDQYVKYTLLAGNRLLVAIAGELGPAHVWLRAARRAKAKTIDELMSDFVPGEHVSLVYDRHTHELYVADGAGSLLQPAGDVVAIGSGAAFVRGYLAASEPLGGLDGQACVATAERLLVQALQASSKQHLSISPDCDVLLLTREPARAPRTSASRRRSASQRADRRAA